ncbi:GGDEF domain-containing protein [Vibrio sinaloensis]|uniref:GGDEF domain-containing protein n=1 Tax=Photobacterium sp. (strain ATCC 43367) TaxID=379097 RepID=UPI0020618296|nr:GGDEF domain-containing protein [Vibrio sinaloensis]UPQ89183.1 GGDEF domain-containing protein [Vibrio sinaloensis]
MKHILWQRMLKPVQGEILIICLVLGSLVVVNVPRSVFVEKRLEYEAAQLETVKALYQSHMHYLYLLINSTEFINASNPILGRFEAHRCNYAPKSTAPCPADIRSEVKSHPNQHFFVLPEKTFLVFKQGPYPRIIWFNSNDFWNTSNSNISTALVTHTRVVFLTDKVPPHSLEMSGLVIDTDERLRNVSYKGSDMSFLAWQFGPYKFATFYHDDDPLVDSLYQALTACIVLIAFLAFLILRVNSNRKRMKVRSYKDNLTQLHNRHYLDVVKSDFESNTDAHLALIDIDHFKAINDKYGHNAGDRVLREVGYLLKQSLRENDVLIRYGGEEFLLLFNSKSTYAAHQVLDRLRDNIVNRQTSIRTSVSIGFTRINRSLDNSIVRADELLYSAKRSGRNRVHGP